MRRWPLTLFMCCVPTVAFAAATLCAGDCDGDGIVRIDELIRGVDVGLARLPVGVCDAVDGDDDGRAGIDELVAAVGAALGGCPTPTPTSTREATVTATMSPTATATDTATQTATASSTPSATETVAESSPTPEPTPSVSPMATDALTPTRTGTATRSATPSRTRTGTRTATRTRTITATRTVTRTPMATRTVTTAVTSTATRTVVPTRTATRTPTMVPTPAQFLLAQIATERGCIEDGQSPVYLVGETMVVIYRIDGVRAGVPLSTALATLVARAPDQTETELALGVVPAGMNLTVELSAAEPTGVALLRLHASAPGLEESTDAACSVVVAQPVE